VFDVTLGRVVGNTDVCYVGNMSVSRIVITGASGGIGTAATAALRARGATVIGLDLVASDGVLDCDVCDQASVDAAVAEAAERLGGIDVLVNNAGLGDAQDAGEAPDEDALRVLDVNLLGPWRVTAAAMPHLLASRGRVVNIASGLAYMPVPFAAAYVMSKRGVVAYSDVLRLEYGDRLEAVTTIYPGYIRTKIHDAPGRRGVSLEGAVPAEPVEAAGAAIARAALGAPVRDLATTRRGGAGYALLRHVPRRWMDRAISAQARRAGIRSLTPRQEAVR
jgi:NAD(P)-dependent dehydrogenase (short-subunit alcohol dehydrogenase family)